MVWVMVRRIIRSRRAPYRNHVASASLVFGIFATQTTGHRHLAFGFALRLTPWEEYVVCEFSSQAGPVILEAFAWNRC